MVIMRLPALCIVMVISGASSVPVFAGQDEEAVERTIKAASSAAATFSETRDKQAVLQWYSDNYEGTQDGETETKAAIEKWLDAYGSELQQGSRLHFLGAVSNLKPTVSGTLAWATYDYLFQAIRNGELEGQDVGKCTGLLKKEGSRWLIFHEHCSKTRTGQAQ